MVNALPGPDGADVDDGWFWVYGNSSSYTASSAYASLLTRNRFWLENATWN